jgi:hypothetical protein
MKDQEAILAWRLFELNWIPIVAFCAVLALSLLFTDFTLEPFGSLALFGLAAIYTSFAYYNAKAATRGNAKIVFMLGAIAQANLVAGLAAILAYIAAAPALPLQDAKLHAVDQLLGLDWRAYLAFVNDRPLLSALLAKCYGMIGSQMLIVPLVLAALGYFCRLQRYILALVLTLVVTIAISALAPAMGVYHHLGLTPADHPNVNPVTYLDCVRELPLVRDGSLRHLDLFGLAGLVTFPSFHAASAVLYGWALWPLRWGRPLVMVINGGMLAATPIGGGHYFVDVFAGVAIAAGAIWFARATEWRLLVSRGKPADSPSGGLPAPVLSD